LQKEQFLLFRRVVVFFQPPAKSLGQVLETLFEFGQEERA
jgi:hypothetical protein